MATQIKSTPFIFSETLLTVEQWGEFPDSPACELVNGRIVENPPVALWHEVLLSRLILFLLPFVQVHKLGTLVFSRARLRITSDTGREPDLFLIPLDQYHLHDNNVFRGIPPFVVEIISPSNAATDRIEKYEEYAELGIPEYWIVDSMQRRVEIHRLRHEQGVAQHYELVETIYGNDVFRPSLFAELEIPLAEIWPVEFEESSDDPASN